MIFVCGTKTLFSQCAIIVSGGDYPWCNPCEGSVSALMTSGTPPYSYNWSTGDTTNLVTGLCAGTYTVTVTDNIGCVAIDSVTINQIGTPITAINLSSTAASCPTCCDACVNVNIVGGCTPYSYLWNPGDPTWPPCSACPFQSLTITVIDACGCSLSDSLTTDTVAVGTTEIQAIKYNEINIYPNPSKDILTLEIDNFNSPCTATITDIYGNILLTETINNKTTKIATSHFSAGIYFITLQNNKQVLQTTKWIKAP